ncbi:MAG: DoxX family protein [Flammeovirgaceae bacterium]|nr:MAG: DoxX family protein [Flammeovirgaceae bacterium]
MNSKSRLLQFSITGIRLFLGLIFFTAGMAKLTQNFPGIIGPVWLEEKLAPYGLGLYARFIAWSQVVVGVLLLSHRFATIGAVLLFPIVLNIWVVTISLEWRGTPYVNLVLLILNLALLAWDYHKLKFLFTDSVEGLKAAPVQRKSPLLDVIWALGFILIAASVPLIRNHHPFGYGFGYNRIYRVYFGSGFSVGETK